MDDDLFVLDEFSHEEDNHAPSFVVERLAGVSGVEQGVGHEEDMDLDEFEEETTAGTSSSSAEGLLSLLEKEKQQQQQQQRDVEVGLGLANLSSEFCEWLIRDTTPEHVLQSLLSFAQLCKDAASTKTSSSENAAFSSYDDAFGSSYRRNTSSTAASVSNDLLLAEAATWELLHATVSDLRAQEKEGRDVLDSAEVIRRVASDKWTSEERLFSTASRVDADIRRWRRVASWLEHVYGWQTGVAKAGGVRNEHYWESTRRELERGNTVERDPLTGAEAALVTKLDPDAPLRETTPSGDARNLHSVDQAMDERLLKRVWELIRAGRIGQAVAECSACQQQWRSAVLMGMQSYHDPKIENENDPVDARGNMDPAILREVCDHISSNVKANVHERAVYGLFAGRLESVLAACRSLHDFQWAYFKINILQRFLGLKGGAAGQGVRTDEQMLDMAAAAAGVEHETRQSLVQIQRFIILGQLNELVHYLMQLQARDDCPPVLHRFVTTLLLVLSKLSCPILNPQPGLVLADAQRSVVTYLQKQASVTTNRPATMVALCLQLPAEHRVDYLARFVSDAVERQSAQETRENEARFVSEEEKAMRAARKQARRWRFVQAIDSSSLNTVEVLRRVVLNLLPPQQGEVNVPNFSDQPFGGAVGTGSHLPMVEVLGWLTLRSEHWRESVVMANLICRQLALWHRVSDMRDVLKALPDLTLERCRNACVSAPDKISVAFAFELELWRVLCDAYQSFSAWHGARYAPIPDYALVRTLYDEAELSLRRVTDFPEQPLFSTFVPFTDNEYHRAQLAAIRDAYIPQAFLMLHFLHFQSGQFRKCLALADDVADQRRRLWMLFMRSNMLERFMALMKEAAVSSV